jgi:uncharacterized protein
MNDQRVVGSRAEPTLLRDPEGPQRCSPGGLPLLRGEVAGQDLLGTLRCPADASHGPNSGMLDPVDNAWLVCRDCGYKYPIIEGIPVMLMGGEQAQEEVSRESRVWRRAQAVESQEWSVLKWDRAGTLWHLAYRAEAARLLEKHVAKTKIDRAVDVGVGPAGIGFLSRFGPSGAMILGIEPLKRTAIAIEDLDLAQYVGGLRNRVRYIQARGEELPLAPASIDLAVCLNVLDHTETPARVLDSIRHCLRDRGILLLGNNIFSALGRVKFETLRLALGDRRQNFLAHPHSWTGGGMARLLSNHGFRCLENTQSAGLRQVAGKAEMCYWVCEKVS